MISSSTQVANDLSDFTKEWKRYRSQKQRMRGGTEARILLNLCLYFGEQYAQQANDIILSRAFKRDEDKNKLHLVFNFVRRATKRRLGRVWGVQHEFYATPNINDPRANDRADVVNKLIKAQERIVHQKRVMWAKLFWTLIGGVAIEHSNWVPNAVLEPSPIYSDSGELMFRHKESGQQVPKSVVDQAVAQGIPHEQFEVAEDLDWQGEIGADIISPLNFFIDNAVISIDQLPPDQGCYVAEIKTLGWIGETFGSEAVKELERGGGGDLAIIQSKLQDRGPTFANINMRDLIPAVSGSRDRDDPPMAILLTRYQPAHQQFPYGRMTLMVPGQTILHDGEIPYGYVPLKDTHYEPQATSFFSGDFVSDEVAPQKFLNKRMSQLGEAANASIYEVLLLGPGLSKEDIPSDMPGIVEDAVSPEGVPLVQPMPHSGLQGWFIESIRMVVEMFEHISGSDLTSIRNKYTQMRGSLSLPIIQEIIDSEDGPFYEHLGDTESVIRQWRVDRAQKFYPDTKTLKFTGPYLRDEVMEFYTKDVLRSGYNFTVSIDRGTLYPELSSMREERINSRLSGPLGAILYTNRRTGKIDPSKVAFDLKYTDRGRETREVQARKLARDLIAMVNDGQDVLSIPEFPFPFLDHDAMMDEYEAAMSTTEFLKSASPFVRQQLAGLYEKHRAILSQLQEAANASIQNQMVARATAQASQQAAAQAAAATVESSREQLMAQGAAEEASPVEGQLRRLIGKGQETGTEGSAQRGRVVQMPPRVR